MLTLVGGSIVAVWWAQLGSAGHLDDTLVLAVVAFAILELARGRRIPAAALLGLTLAIKPWAVIFLPLVLAGGQPHDDLPGRGRDQRRRAALIAVLVGVLLWAPFVLAYPKTISAIKPVVNVAPDSVLHLFGVTTANLPSSMRVFQLLAAMVVVAVAVRRGHLAGAALAGVAMRMATDPATWTYYTPGLVGLALGWDLVVSRRRVPLATIAAGLLLLPPRRCRGADARGVMRLVACLGAVVWVLSRSVAVSAPSRSGDRSCPTPDRSATG